MKRVVITGMGAVTPLGLDVRSTFDNMLKGVNGIGPITRFDLTGHKARLAAEIKDFPTEKYFERMEARKLDLFSQYGIAAAIEAMNDTGLVAKEELDESTEATVSPNINPERLGVYVGSGVGGLGTLDEQYGVMIEKGVGRISAATIPMLIGNILTAHIAIKYNAKGVNLPVVTACATGSHAIGEAFLAIRSGMADAIIAGGSEACINKLAIASFANMMALSLSDDPNAASLPFDARRKGFVMGEGAGILVLEEYEHAKARGANIYCEVVGYGNTCDAYHITAPMPCADGLIRAIKMAMGQGGIKGDEKVYFNAHGTGTEFNDKAETIAIKNAFGDRAKDVVISSTKSMTGHMLGAAGAVEAIVAIKTLMDGKIPPTINLNEKCADCDLDYTPNKMREFAPDVAMSTNLGFGGHNVALVFKKI